MLFHGPTLPLHRCAAAPGHGCGAAFAAARGPPGPGVRLFSPGEVAGEIEEWSMVQS